MHPGDLLGPQWSVPCQKSSLLGALKLFLPRYAVSLDGCLQNVWVKGNMGACYGFFFFNSSLFILHLHVAGNISVKGNAVAAASSYLPLHGITFTAADFKEI